MNEQDLLVTPIYFLLFLVVGFTYSKKYNPILRSYFLMALFLRMICSVLLGVIYQFNYKGGDTFNYFEVGSYNIWQAYLNEPMAGLSLLFSDGTLTPTNFKYAVKIWFFKDEASMFVSKVASIIDLLTFHTYSATSLFFALISFACSWKLYISLVRHYPQMEKQFAISILFIPSVIFWSSGILKDTLVIGAMFLFLAAILEISYSKKGRFSWMIALVIALLVIYKIKLYILLVLIPALLTSIFYQTWESVRSAMMRYLFILPVVVVLILCIWTATMIISDRSKYALGNIANTSKITAYDIGFISGRGAGSGYNLGEQDGTIGGQLRLFPKAIIASFFRPFIWEVNSPIMLLSALENILILILFLLVTARVVRISDLSRREISVLMFCFLFAISFAFAVGVSTYNFGTLSRYRIPMVPALITGLLLIIRKPNNVIKSKD